MIYDSLMILMRMIMMATMMTVFDDDCDVAKHDDAVDDDAFACFLLLLLSLY